MTISTPEREAKKVKIAVDRNPVETSFEKWACDLKQRFDKQSKTIFLTYLIKESGEPLLMQLKQMMQVG